MNDLGTGLQVGSDDVVFVKTASSRASTVSRTAVVAKYPAIANTRMRFAQVVAITVADPDRGIIGAGVGIVARKRDYRPILRGLCVIGVGIAEEITRNDRARLAAVDIQTENIVIASLDHQLFFRFEYVHVIDPVQLAGQVIEELEIAVDRLQQGRTVGIDLHQ